MKTSEINKIIDECERNAPLDSEIDLSDIPETTNFKGFYPVHPEYFKPRKTQTTIRLNTVLLDHLKQTGKGWQTRVNEFLMSAVKNGQL